MFLCIPSKADFFQAFQMVYYIHITLRKAMDHFYKHTFFVDIKYIYIYGM